MKKINKAACLSMAISGVMAVHSMASPIPVGDIVIYQTGSGTGALSSAGTAVFVDDYEPNGTLRQQIAMPTVNNGAQNEFVASGTATSEGLLTVSPNGQYISLTGYKAAVGTSAVATTTSALTPRVIGLISTGDGSVDTSTALTDFSSANNPRSAVTADGTNLYFTGAAGGVRYATKGSTTSTQLTPTTGTPTPVSNFEELQISGGQLYASSQKGGGSGVQAFSIGTIGSGLPTTAGSGTESNLPGLPASSGNNYSFSLVSLPGAGSSSTELYVANGGASTPTILKYSLIAGTWTAEGSISLPGSATADAITGVSAETLLNGSVEIYATSPTKLLNFNDSTGSGTVSGTANLLASAATNTAFRGVAVVPEPGTLSLLVLAGVPILARRKRRQA